MLVQSARAVKYINCIPTGGWDAPSECSGYDIKQSDSVALVNVEYPFIAIAPGPLWPGVGAPDSVLSMHQMKMTDT